MNKTGLLFKSNDKRKAWKQKYVVVASGCVAVYKSNKGKRPDEVIPLPGYHVEIDEELTRREGFNCFRLVKVGAPSHWFYSEEPSGRALWMATMQSFAQGGAGKSGDAAATAQRMMLATPGSGGGSSDEGEAAAPPPAAIKALSSPPGEESSSASRNGTTAAVAVGAVAVVAVAGGVGAAAMASGGGEQPTVDADLVLVEAMESFAAATRELLTLLKGGQAAWKEATAAAAVQRLVDAATALGSPALADVKALATELRLEGFAERLVNAATLVASGESRRSWGD